MKREWLTLVIVFAVLAALLAMSWAIARLEAAEPILTIKRGVVDGVVNVRDHGADGSDAEDDSASIQAAIDASTGPVYFPPGKYLVSETLTITKPGVRLFGFGSPRGHAKSVWLEWTRPDGVMIKLSTGNRWSGFRMDGLFLSGKGRHTTSTAVLIDTGGELFNRHLRFDAIGIQSFGRAIVCEPVTDGKIKEVGHVLIDGCVLHWNGQHLKIVRGNNVVISRSELTQALATTEPAMHLEGDGVVIRNCILEGQPKAVLLQGVRGGVVEQCRFEGNKDYVLRVVTSRGIRFRDNYHFVLGAEHYPNRPVWIEKSTDVEIQTPTVAGKLIEWARP